MLQNSRYIDSIAEQQHKTDNTYMEQARITGPSWLYSLQTIDLASIIKPNESGQQKTGQISLSMGQT